LGKGTCKTIKLLIEMQGKKIIILIKLMLIFLNTIFTMEKDVHDTSSEHDIHD